LHLLPKKVETILYYAYGEVIKENYQDACKNDENINKKYEEIKEKYGENSWQENAFLMEYKLIEDEIKDEENENNKKLDEAMENNDWILYAKTIQEIQNKERYKKEFNLRIDNKVEYKFDYLNQAIKNYSDGLSLKDQVSKKQAKEEKEKYLVSQYIVENKQNIMKTDTIEMKLQEFYNYNDIIIIFAVMLISAGVALNKEQNNASCIINILKILAYTIGVIALGIIIQIISAMIVYKIGFAGLPGWIIFNEKMIVANPLIITGIRMLLRLPIYLVISVFMYSIIKKRKS